MTGMSAAGCRVYWGSHGCSLLRGHAGDGHDCGCCECKNHPDAGDGVLCVATAPYYGPETRFYGEDAVALGLPLTPGEAERATSRPR